MANITANATRNWKTTLFGILTLCFTGLSIYSNPKSLSDPQTQAAIVGGISTGVGLILAKDGDKTGTIPPTSPTS